MGIGIEWEFRLTVRIFICRINSFNQSRRTAAMQFRRIQAVVWLGVVFLVFVGAATAAGKVGYIDLQRLVVESKTGKEAREDIQKMRKAKQEDLARRLDAINTMKESLNEKWEDLDLRERRDRRAELKRAYEDYQKMVNDAKEDILREDRQIVAIILEKADGVLKEVAEKNRYSIILKDPNAIGYLDPAVDITDEVLKELNR
jgi:outer membrane protein